MSNPTGHDDSGDQTDGLLTDASGGADGLRASFDGLSAWLDDQASALAGAGQILFANWLGEHSDFVRFNHGRVRQAGTVSRFAVTLRLIVGLRSTNLTLTLSGDLSDDARRLDAALAGLREDLLHARDDPFLLFDRNDPKTPADHRVSLGASPAPEAVVNAVREAGEQIGGADLVGFYAGGPMARGLVSSLGHDYYHQGLSWVFDFSLFSPQPQLRDKAVKSQASGREWQPAVLISAVRQAALQVPLLAKPPRRLSPGRYRTLLAPSACADLISTLGWGGFSARALRTGQSPLARLQAGDVQLDRRVILTEDLAAGQVPRFQDSGFARPGRVDLIREGRLVDSLVSPRTAREFDLPSNAANGQESPEALSMTPGDLPQAQLFEQLGSGLAISNVWYLNYSDRDTCRITGMTRFATMWVEDGVPVAPVDVMRFDDSVFDLLGPQLEALADTAFWLPNADTYEWRGFGGISVPAALIRQMSFTL